MSTTAKRSTKRSVLSMRVAAKRDSGYYEPATITDITSKQITGTSLPPSAGGSSSSSSCSTAGDKLLLKFEDGTTQWYLERQIIGQGFQAISSACLPLGQLVYCTVGHREAPGRLTQSPVHGGELFQISLDDGSGQVISRKQEDMRLVKSRKSARITADKDYHSLALGKMMDISLESMPELAIPTFSVANLSRKRAITLDTGVLSKPLHNTRFMLGAPLNTKLYREDEAALLYESPDGDGDSEESNLGGEEAENRDEDGDVLMDECSAALVLMSLGASPGSGCKATAFDPHDDAGFLSASCSSVYGSSWPCDNNSRHRLPGAPRPLSPSSFHDSTTASSDEGIEMASSSTHRDPCHQDHDYSAWAEPPDWGPLQRPRKRRPSGSVMFQCTWPKCQHVESARTGVKRHIQNVHFTSAGLPAEDLEFYYNEIDGCGSGGSGIDSSPSPPTLASPGNGEKGLTGGAGNGSAYAGRSGVSGQRQRSTLSTSSDISIASSSRYSKHSAIAKPINIPRTTSKRREWESVSAPHTASDGHSVSSSSMGNSSKLLKVRDVKKCRKVYGMDNREMWCTQCKWKKACTRFAEQ